MKKSIKLFALAMTMVFAVSVLFAGCGETKTLEQYFADNPEEQTALDEAKESLNQPGMNVDVAIKENAIIYTMKFDQTFEGEQLDTLKSALEEPMTNTLGPVLESVAKQCEEETEIKGVTCQVIIQNGDGAELYNNTFEPSK